MNPMNQQHNIRELEVLVYGSAPLQPQPVFERDQSAYMDSRWIRSDEDVEQVACTGRAVWEIRLNRETGEISRIPVNDADN